jgi:hypothetical protein
MMMMMMVVMMVLVVTKTVLMTAAARVSAHKGKALRDGTFLSKLEAHERLCASGVDQYVATAERHPSGKCDGGIGGTVAECAGLVDSAVSRR